MLWKLEMHCISDKGDGDGGKEGERGNSVVCQHMKGDIESCCGSLGRWLWKQWTMLSGRNTYWCQRKGGGRCLWQSRYVKCHQKRRRKGAHKSLDATLLQAEQWNCLHLQYNSLISILLQFQLFTTGCLGFTQSPCCQSLSLGKSHLEPLPDWGKVPCSTPTDKLMPSPWGEGC